MSTRQASTLEKVSLAVADGTRMALYVARPKGRAEHGMLVFQEAFGVNDYIRRIAERFAEQGYLAVAPELFHRSGPGFEGSYTDYAGVRSHMEALTDEGLTADTRAAFDWLVEQGVPTEGIASVGFCMGGRASFLANATLPLAAAISFYGGGIAQTLLDRTEKLSGPTLLLWGGQDTHVTAEHARAVHDALVQAHKPFVDATFSEADHGFACDARASYHEPSAKIAWALVDAFLAQYVVRSPAL